MTEFNVGNYDTTPKDLRDYVLNSGGGLRYVYERSDLPAASEDGVINLASNTAYYIPASLDLEGLRLNSGQNTAIFGSSAETTIITSTGLEGTALLSSNYTMPVRDLSITAEVAINLDATEFSGQALDWRNVNFVDCETVGTIKGYDNFIAHTLGFLNAAGLTFDGDIGTVGITDTIFNAYAFGTSIIIPSTATISRRIRFDKCAFIILSGETGLNVSASATIPSEGYILDRINFAGGGTYITGVQFDDTKALFEGCRGINNSSTVGQYYVVGNASETSILVSGTFYKVAGTMTEGTLNERFDVTTVSNRAIYKGSLTDNFRVTVVMVVEGGNNKEFSIRFAKNGTIIGQSESSSTTSGNGRAENLVTQDIVNLGTDDYIEIFIANTTDTSNLTAVNVNFVIERIS